MKKKWCERYLAWFTGIRSCEVCGGEIPASDFHHRFCSRACRAVRHNKRKGLRIARRKA